MGKWLKRVAVALVVLAALYGAAEASVALMREIRSGTEFVTSPTSLPTPRPTPVVTPYVRQLTGAEAAAIAKETRNQDFFEEWKKRADEAKQTDFKGWLNYSEEYRTCKAVDFNEVSKGWIVVCEGIMSIKPPSRPFEEPLGPHTYRVNDLTKTVEWVR